MNIKHAYDQHRLALGELIREKRASKGLSISQMANMFGITNLEYMKWEGGDSVLKPKIIAMLSDILD